MEILYYFDQLDVGLVCKIFKSSIDVFENIFFFFCNSYHHKCVSNNHTSIIQVCKPNEYFLAMWKYYYFTIKYTSKYYY